MALTAAVTLLIFAAAAPLATAFNQPFIPGFVTPEVFNHAGSNERAARKAADAEPQGWKSTAWQAIRANTTAQLRDVSGSFAAFKAHRRRKYANTHAEQKAHAAFKANLEFIVKENAKGTNSFVLGVTNFTDLPYEEFAARYLMQPQAPPTGAGSSGKRGRRSLLSGQGRRLQADTATSTCNINWGTTFNPLGRSVVSPVKDQGSCGSCWAFGGAAALESWIAMQNYTMDTGTTLDVSEQMLVDCSYAGYNGCAGGWPTAAWDYIKSNGGVASEAVRPYTSGKTGSWSGSCPGSQPRALGSSVINGYTQVAQQDDGGLVAALQKQPLFTAVAAGAEFQNYAGGAISCAGTQVTHAVQTIGCGYYNTGTAAAPSYVPVYLFKNSWGQYWGYGGLGIILRTTQSGGNCLLGSGAYYLN